MKMRSSVIVQNRFIDEKVELGLQCFGKICKQRGKLQLCGMRHRADSQREHAKFKQTESFFSNAFEGIGSWLSLRHFADFDQYI